MRVLIVGGGIAGLSAGRELHERGVEVIILESRNRIGGRTHTETFGGIPIDLGASWLHTLFPHPLLNQTLGLGLRVLIQHSFVDNLSLHGLGARQFDSSILTSSIAKIETLKKDFDKNLYPQDLSISQAISNAQKLTPEKLKPSPDEIMMIQWLWGCTENYENASLDDLSFLSYLDSGTVLEKSYDGFMMDGFAALVSDISKPISSSIRLNERVSEIYYQSEKGVRVLTSGGREYVGDHVLVTVPLGILKRGDILFHPILPAEKRGAIERLGFGQAGKMYLEFPHLFWPAGKLWLGHLTDDEGLGGRINIFFNLYQVHHKPILCAFLKSEVSQRFEKIGDEEAVEIVLDALRDMFGAIPRPCGYRLSRWGEDENCRGSYSFLRLGSSRKEQECLAAPLGRLSFAGEATGDPIGTVNGAVLSALRYAHRFCGPSRL